ncbi:DNA polymerase Y family protein [Aromatoleum toluvorans]|uniref:DNA polymerase Y family protein n=1 Tax=Aromatoleum toluvorans TaxID=92002 RepID=A0ABX1PXY0_9RHOO|nr:DNA polymerase Y family protein [Aromatoleum toluvorans]NMG44065.1 DNA polymerase Y family protein [Aromatoleum toluvorans]
MLWFALILSDLPLQVFTRGVDEPGELAVVEHAPGARVVAATPTALARGVEAGQGVAGALAVAPSLHLRERDPALEAATLEEFAAWAAQFTPCVSIDPPDTLVLETSASLRLFGGVTGLVRRIRAGLVPLGLNAAIAAAPTPLAARWLARTHPGRQIRGTAGWRCQLDEFPVELLGDGAEVARATLDLLYGIGARRIGDVARLPRDGLARRQAGVVLDTLARARGERPDPRRWFIPPERFEARLALPASILHTEPLLFAAGRLFSGLSAWLAARHAALDRCCLCLEHEDRPDTVLEIVTGTPGRDDGRLLMLAREHLAALALPAPVEALRLSADNPVSTPGRTPDLFGDPDSARDSAALLLDRLRARLGRDAVRTVHPVSEHRPERAWRLAEPGRLVPRDVPPAAGPRPLWLMREPRALDSIRALTLLNGPERIESGWWDGTDVRRDYYVARAPDAALWWVFELQDPPGGWYVHGYFG